MTCAMKNESEINDKEWTSNDDASWMLTNAFLVLTMQSGFGLLEAGCVSSKNAANIMVKNVVDVTLGGITYWSFGYGLSWGEPSTPFFGMGDFFLHTNSSNMGSLYTKYVFQFSFATAATTIVSGAIAERMKLTSYMAFSVLNTFVYCIPVCWVWNDAGFLKRLGFFDWAGSCVVHLTGGVSAFVAAWMLGPRLGRFGPDDHYEMSSPVTALTGTFMLWWAWLGFNCGSSLGITGVRWKAAAKVALNTLNGSIGGGLAGLSISAVLYKGQFDIGYLIMSVLGGLVSVTGACSVIEPFVSILLGAVGAASAIGLSRLLDHFAFVDDPVGAIPVHFGSAAVGTIAVGLVANNDVMDQLGELKGLFYGGGFYLLTIQLAGMIIVIMWSATCTAGCFYLMDKTIGVRVTPEQEILGADWVEHRVRSVGFTHKLEQAFRKLDMHEDAVETLMKKLLADGEDPSQAHSHGRGAGRVRQLSADEQRRVEIARAVRRLHDEQQRGGEPNGIRWMPNDGHLGLANLPGAIEAVATELSVDGRLNSGRRPSTMQTRVSNGLRLKLERDSVVINPHWIGHERF